VGPSCHTLSRSTKSSMVEMTPRGHWSGRPFIHVNDPWVHTCRMDGAVPMVRLLCHRSVWSGVWQGEVQPIATYGSIIFGHKSMLRINIVRIAVQNYEQHHFFIIIKHIFRFELSVFFVPITTHGYDLIILLIFMHV
jgi:hypothetical protein